MKFEPNNMLNPSVYIIKDNKLFLGYVKSINGDMAGIDTAFLLDHDGDIDTEYVTKITVPSHDVFKTLESALENITHSDLTR